MKSWWDTFKLTHSENQTLVSSPFRIFSYLAKTLEQLIQTGMEVQDGLERAAEPTGPHPPAEEEAEALTPALTNESVASDRTQPE